MSGSLKKVHDKVLGYFSINHFSQKLAYFTKHHWSVKLFVGKLKPQVHPNICQEAKVLCCMLLEKHFTTKFFSFLWRRDIVVHKSRMMERWTDRQTHMTTIPLGQTYPGVCWSLMGWTWGSGCRPSRVYSVLGWQSDNRCHKIYSQSKGSRGIAVGQFGCQAWCCFTTNHASYGEWKCTSPSANSQTQNAQWGSWCQY